MNTIKEYADFYRQLRIWVFPFNRDNTQMSYWKYWRDIKENQYIEQNESYNWKEADGIKIVVGKKGIRVLVLNSIENEKNKIDCLYRILAMLKLPADYPWIIEIGNSFAIIVDTLSDIMGMGNRTYAECLLLWEGSFVLPSPTNKRCFYNNHLPKEHPVQIKNESLFACINYLRNPHVDKRENDVSTQTAEEAAAEANKIIEQITYRYNDFYKNFIHIGAFVWFLLIGSFCFYFISSFFIALFVWILTAIVIHTIVVIILKFLTRREIDEYIKKLPENEMVKIVTSQSK